MCRPCFSATRVRRSALLHPQADQGRGALLLGVSLAPAAQVVFQLLLRRGPRPVPTTPSEAGFALGGCGGGQGAGCSGLGGSLQRGAVTERGANIRGRHPIPLLMLTPVGEVPVQLIGDFGRREGDLGFKTPAFAAEAGLLPRWRSASATLDRRSKDGDRGAAAGLYDRAA